MNPSCESEKHKIFIRELVKQLCHPVNGLPKNLFPLPITLGDWKKCLNGLYGWVNLGIEQKLAETLHKLRIGEVIPSNLSSMDIYNYGFATIEIGKLLGMDKKEKTFKAFINYDSFSRLIKILLNGRDEKYCGKFNSSLRIIFSDMDPKTFWLNILISEPTADYLKNNEIGEVIVNEGILDEVDMLKAITEQKQELVSWDNMTDEDMGGNTDKKTNEYPKTDFSEMDLSVASETPETLETPETKEEDEYLSHRLLMNNETLLNLINYACVISNNISDNTNVFKLMGGEDASGNEEEFTKLFGKMQI